jgi:uncharacterized protein
MKSGSQTTVHVSNQNRMLVIMAKAPRPGMVKTRLNQNLPSPAVTALYRCLLEDTVALAKSLSGVGVAVMCPESDKAALTHLLGNVVEVVAQKGEGLAAGLTSVFAHFTANVERRVIAFNSDSPHLSPSVLNRAFQTLATCDVVVGPTYDGGYYLVGAKAAHPALFEDNGMGTRGALDRLLARAQVLELSTGLTDPFYDIDVADDLVQLATELRFAPERAPRTAAWFAEWGQTVAKLRLHTGKL